VYVNACDELGIEVLPPDVNSSQTDFAVVEGKIRFGLNAVKSVGESAARAIIRAREEGGKFESIWDFTERVDPQVVEQAVTGGVVKCGALDSTGASRMGDARVPRAGARVGAEARRPTGWLAGVDLRHRTAMRPAAARSRGRSTIPRSRRASTRSPELLKLEKETLGLYVSEHPLKAVREQLRRKTDCVLSGARAAGATARS
jgi:DNA polymerase-3 subunit alpha